MQLVDINWSPTIEQLRKFGITMLIGFTLIASLSFLFGASILVGLILFGIGLTSFALSRLGKPALLIYMPWMTISLVMGTIVSQLIVAIIFFGLITPIGLICRLLGRDILNVRSEKPYSNRDSYWVDIKEETLAIHDYERQF